MIGSRRLQVAVAFVATAAALSLAGCGSNISPQSLSQEPAVVGPADAEQPAGAPTDPQPVGTDPVDQVAPPAPGTPESPVDQPDVPQDGPTDAPSDGPPPADPPPGEGKAASCEGLANGPGITDTAITIGNASDVSGPVPGIFEGAQRGVQAYVAYFNASGATICGRSLRLVSYDSQSNAGIDQQRYAAACDEVFAAVGSMSGFDSGGAQTAEACGLPDLRAISVSAERAACDTCYAAQPAGPSGFQNAVPDYVIRNHDGGQHAAMLYLDTGVAASNALSQVKLMTKRGMKYVYVSPIGVAEFNYAPYVQAMKDKGVETVQFIGAGPQFAKLTTTMQQQGFEPDLLLLDPTAYSVSYTGVADSSAEGTIVFANFVPIEEAARNPETARYVSWLAQVSPSARPDFYGIFGWSAARLFVEQATRLGGRLSRSSLVDALGRVDNWTGGGLHSPMHVGAKGTAECWRFLRWTGSAWVPDEGTKYQCTGITRP